MKKLFISLIVALSAGLIVPVAIASSSYAQLDAGIKATCTEPNCEVTKENASTKANDIVADVINIFSWIVGVVSVIMVIFAGFKYITSAGDAGKVTSAKNTLLYALVGLVIVALAQAIVWFVLGEVTTAA